MGNTVNRPQNVAILSYYKDYEVGRPQNFFDSHLSPGPGRPDMETIEETPNVFSKVIFDSAANDKGFVLIHESNG